MQEGTQQITICPECEGWGKMKDSGNTCTSCEGKGLYITSGNQFFAFDVPPYVDFGSRRKGAVIKFFLYGGCVVILLIVVVVLLVLL